MENQFIIIPRTFKTVEENTKFLDILVYAIIRSYETDGKSSIAYKTISEKYHIATAQVERAVERLEKMGVMSHTQQQSPNNTDYVYNVYKFKECKNFLMLDPKVLTLPYNPKERGFLIYLQLHCTEGTNQAMIDGLLEDLKVDKRTFNKYMKFFKAKNEIEFSRYGNVNCKYTANTPLIKTNNQPLTIIL